MKYLKIPVKGLSKMFRNQIRLQSTQNHLEWQQPSGVDTGISIYNCIAKKKVPLIINNNTATWYSCGPTVYDSAHIGHASCYVKLDIIQRILIDYFKLNLITSMGVTDIDDKIIKKSKETKMKPEEVAMKYELEFWENLVDLDIMMPQMISRVTDHIPTIKDFIAEIAKKNLTYIGHDNSVYFDTEAYGKYGKLHKAQEVEKEDDIAEKKSPADFALWKAHKPGEPFWESTWGNGRPGWHIECSAMVSWLFGKTVDFHAGGIDLRFPHHENEEAQSCAYHGHTQWANYWLHPGHLQTKGDVKMSKSLKNTLSINDLLKSHTASTFRMACLLSHYRNQMEYSEAMMKNAKATHLKFKYFLADCKAYMNNNTNSGAIDEAKLFQELENTKTAIDKALKDDFDTAKCMASILHLVSETNKMLLAKSSDSQLNNFNPIPIGIVSRYVEKTLNCFGLSLENKILGGTSKLPEMFDLAVKFRHNIRLQALKTQQHNLLKECDSFRDCLLKQYKIKINDQSGEKIGTWMYIK